MWKINGKEISGKVVLGPMAGYTSSGYRKFYSAFGYAFAYTEMISDMGLIYGNKETIDYLPKEKEKYPIGVQLFGSDPINLAKASKIVVEKAPFIDFIDINMGCPVPKVNKTGAGCSLMSNPKLCGEIVRQVKEASCKEVSVKIRLGIDDKHINYQEVIDEVIKAGVSFIAIHARTKKQLYHGEPRYDILSDLGNKISVPLIVSGDIYSVDDATKAMEITKASAVMVARGGLGNPILLTQLNNYFSKKNQIENPSYKEQKHYCLELAKELIEEKGEELAMRVYRSMASKFFSGLPNVKQLNSKLSSELTTYESLKNILDEYENYLLEQEN